MAGDQQAALEAAILATWRALMSPAEAERIGPATLMVMASEAADEIERLRAMADASQLPRRWRHKKSGTVYVEIGRGELQIATQDVVDGSTIVIYRDEDGWLWAREEREFEDGRFEEVPDNGQ